MDVIQSFLAWDEQVFQSALVMVRPEWAFPIHLLSELVVIFVALFLVLLWLYGVYRKEDAYKRSSYGIFLTIVGVFVFYVIINMMLPQFRPGAMQISGATAIIPHPTDNSFPSGHALFFGASLFGLWRYFRYTGMLVLTSIIGLATVISRVLG